MILVELIMLLQKKAYRINPHYSLTLLKINTNVGYPYLVEANFGRQIWLWGQVAVGDPNNYLDE